MPLLKDKKINMNFHQFQELLPKEIGITFSNHRSCWKSQNSKDRLSGGSDQFDFLFSASYFFSYKKTLH
jgi:hypothetical protein